MAIPEYSEKMYLKVSYVRSPLHADVKNHDHQGCKLSRIIWETPDFEPLLQVSRLEYEISRVIAEVCHFLWI